MNAYKSFPILIIIILQAMFCRSQDQFSRVNTIPYDTYPEVLGIKPELPSPFMTKDGKEYVIAVTKENKYAIMEVTLSNNRAICQQLVVDTADFPLLAETGLHSRESLDTTRTITSRSLKEITELGLPNGLSTDGFLAQDENILSVIQGDNDLVRRSGLTHPRLAKPLFHVLNMMDTDLSLNRWNMAKHQWDNIRYFYYNNKKVFVEAYDTKGGQESIFDDKIQGAFYIKLWREPDTEENTYLEKHYGDLPEDEFREFITKLSRITTGEMEPQYIMRYGFYEGHTSWRADPIAISFIFGLKDLPEMDRLLEGRLNDILSRHYAE